jgi:hypothetical protein
MRIRAILAAALAVAISAGAMADGGKGVVAADVASKNVKNLLESISWHKDLEQAKSAARAEGKLVFWMHVKGKLDGMT